MHPDCIGSSVAGGQVITQDRHFMDAAGVKHHVVFREIDHGHGVKIYDIFVNEILLPRIDYVLYYNILNLSEDCLAAYFSPTE